AHIWTVGEPNVNVRAECRLRVVDRIMQLRGGVNECEEGEDAEDNERTGQHQLPSEVVLDSMEDHEERKNRRRNDRSDHNERVTLNQSI
ncbi:hypothetical protein PMAYCL1PPCAC_31469, partial [Pristionchus mayeri]